MSTDPAGTPEVRGFVVKNREQDRIVSGVMSKSDCASRAEWLNHDYQSDAYYVEAWKPGRWFTGSRLSFERGVFDHLYARGMKS